MGAIGAGVRRRRAAIAEFRRSRIAQRPTAHRFLEFDDRHPQRHRHDDVLVKHRPRVERRLGVEGERRGAANRGARAAPRTRARRDALRRGRARRRSRGRREIWRVRRGRADEPCRSRRCGSGRGRAAPKSGSRSFRPATAGARAPLFRPSKTFLASLLGLRRGPAKGSRVRRSKTFRAESGSRAWPAALASVTHRNALMKGPPRHVVVRAS